MEPHVPLQSIHIDAGFVQPAHLPDLLPVRTSPQNFKYCCNRVSVKALKDSVSTLWPSSTPNSSLNSPTFPGISHKCIQTGRRVRVNIVPKSLSCACQLYSTVLRLYLRCDYRNCGSTAQANHNFPGLFPDRYQIPGFSGFSRQMATLRHTGNSQPQINLNSTVNSAILMLHIYYDKFAIMTNKTSENANMANKPLTCVDTHISRCRILPWTLADRSAPVLLQRHCCRPCPQGRPGESPSLTARQPTTHNFIYATAFRQEADAYMFCRCFFSVHQNYETTVLGNG